MRTRQFTPEEYLQIYRACLWLRLTGGRLSSALLRNFLVQRLQKGRPDLAGRVRRLSDAEFNELVAALRERQHIAEMLLSD